MFSKVACRVQSGHFRELKFSFDSDGPAGGDVPDIRSPIDEADELEREQRGRDEAEKKQS